MHFHLQLHFVIHCVFSHSLVNLANYASRIACMPVSIVRSRHFRDMVFHQTEMARIIYNAADAAARFDHVFSLFLQGDCAHRHFKFEFPHGDESLFV